MEKFVVEGLSPVFDGEYPIDIDAFTMRELQIIKRMSGVRAGELTESFRAGDSTLIFAIAVIAVRRHGKPWEAFEALGWEADTGKITFVEEAEEPVADAVPLIQPSSSGGSESSAEQQPPSGQPLSDGGAVLPEKNLRAIGSQG